MKLGVKLAARLLLLFAKNRRWKAVHAAADAHVAALQTAVERAFDAGRRKLSRKRLVSALKDQDHSAVLSLVSTAIEATDKSLRKPLEDVLTKIVSMSGESALAALPKKKTLKAAANLFDKTNEKAVAWIKDHAGETIEGISKTTREDIASLLESAFEGEFDANELADRIEDLVGDPTRAEMIARTESMRAANEGQLEAWDQATENGLLTGNELKEWIVTDDDRLCPICEPMDGVQVPIDEDFDVDGDALDGPPAHPYCRCTVGLAVGPINATMRVAYSPDQVRDDHGRFGPGSGRPSYPIGPKNDRGEAAQFIGWQEDGEGGAFALYNIHGGPSHGSSVSEATLKEKGISVPKTPEWKAAGGEGSGVRGHHTDRTRSEKAKAGHKPSDKNTQDVAFKGEQDVHRLVGGDHLPDNEPADILIQTKDGPIAIEVKTIVRADYDKITMHGKSLERKEAFGRKTGARWHTIAVDKRGGLTQYYHRAGLGSFRLHTMDKVSALALRRLVRQK